MFQPVTYFDEKNLGQFLPDLNRKWGIRIRGSSKNRSDSITLELLGLETSFLYFWNPCEVQNLFNVKIFMYDVIDGSGGL